MLSYLSRRILAIIPILLGASFLVFLIVHLTPGDPAQIMLGERASEETIQKMRRELGLDKPFIVQYLSFLKRVILERDFGRSIRTHRPVADDLATCFPATVELATSSLAIAAIVGGLIGVASSVWPDSAVDYTGMAGALVGISMPIFWLGLMLMLVFGVWLGWLPLGGRIDVTYDIDPITKLYLVDTLIEGRFDAFLNCLKHLILPALTLSTIPTALIARMTRSSMIEALSHDSIRTARAKGLPPRKVIFKHALRNAMIPIVTIVGLQFGYLLGGAVLTETIFSWPGLGRYVVDSVLARDFPAIQGGVLLIATVFVLVNLVVDISYAFLDPRVVYE